MKKSILLSLSLIVAVLFQSELSAQESFNVDSKASKLEWVGKKVTGKHNGTILVKSGKVNLEKNGVTGNFEIDMNQIVVKDLSGEYKTKLENHLKSDDFFSVEKFPTATFVISSSKDLGKGKYNITGDLTIKGITNSVSFPATITKNSAGLKAEADITFDRTKWNVQYNSGNFFEGLGDKMIYDDIELKLELVAK